MAVRSTSAGHRPFVGRDRELAAAAQILADGDRAGVALIGGEGGLGKTSLVEEIIAAAPASTVVIRGGAVPRTAPVPFELIRSAVEPLLRATGSDRPLPPLGPWEAVVPENAAPARVLSEAETLRTLGQDGAIFVFEDIHWADAESLEVIDRLLVAGPLEASVLLTYRPNALQPDDPPSTFLRRAERRSHVLQLRLEPFRRDEVAQYLVSAGRTVNADIIDRVHSRTGGNPLLLSELVAATTEAADLTGALPWTLAEMLRPEIERLPPEERAVTEAVAVLGAAVEFDILAAAVAIGEDELIDRLHALVGWRILVESGPDRFSFRHDMIGEAVAESLFAREHRRIHAAVHDHLKATGSDNVGALVTHATGAGRTKEAADAARDAAKQAMADGRTHQALAFAEQAMLEHTDDLDLLRIAVVGGWMSGQYRTALHHLDRWEELVDKRGPARAETLHHRVRLLYERGDSEAADRAAADLAALAKELELGVPLVQALADLAQHHMLRARGRQAIAVADQALAVAATIGPAADQAARQARAERASAMSGVLEQQTEAVTELLLVAEEAAGAGDHLVASRALHNVPLHHPMVDPRPHIERTRQAGMCAGLSCVATASYRRSLLITSELEGDRESYAALLEPALDESDDQAEMSVYASLFALEAGDVETARRLIEVLPDHIGARNFEDDRWAVGWRIRVLALIDLVDGDPEPARRWLSAPAGESPDRRLPDEKFTASRMPQYLSTLLDAGLSAEVAEAMATGDLAESTEPFHRAIRAELARQSAEADRLYNEALSADVRRSVMDMAEIHLARARIAPDLGADGRPHLEAAADALRGWPGRRRQHVESLLGQSNRAGRADRSNRSDGGNRSTRPGGLTPREREVAKLVSRGLTNGGIADELFISTKTASVHVSNILSKLHMSSRAEIAEWVGAGGLE